MSRLTLTLAIGVAGLVCPAFGQQKGGTGPPTPAPSTGGGAATTTPGRTPMPAPSTQTPTTDPNASPFPDQQQRPIFLSGRVMLDAGAPPAEPVVIERVCNGNPRAEGYTDSKGRFSFQLGQNNGMMQDASMSSNNDMGFGTSRNNNNSMIGMNQGISERDLLGCEIRASLAGYTSDSISLGARRAFDNPDLGTIVLHRLSNVEGVTVSSLSLNAPKDAKKSFDKGRDLLQKKKAPEAQKELEKAVGIYPKYATAWFDLGRAREMQNDVEGARKAYGEALAADPKYLYPYRQLMGMYVKEQKWQEVADMSGKLVKLDPVDFPDAHYFNSVANYYLKDFDAAEKSIREAQKLDTRNRMPKSSQLLGAILAEKRDYVGAAEQIKKYLSFLPAGPDADNAKKQLAELERVAGVAKPAPEQ
jgi:tetratricopeptide (TPR) repeat protein